MAEKKSNYFHITIILILFYKGDRKMIRFLIIITIYHYKPAI